MAEQSIDNGTDLDDKQATKLVKPETPVNAFGASSNQACRLASNRDFSVRLGPIRMMGIKRFEVLLELECRVKLLCVRQDTEA